MQFFTELHFALSVDLPGTFTMLIENEWDFKCADISKELIQGSSVMFFFGTFMEVASKSSLKRPQELSHLTHKYPCQEAFDHG